jgi:hypothetical protein
VGGQTAEIRPISHSGEDTRHKIQSMLSRTVVDHYELNTPCSKANRRELSVLEQKEIWDHKTSQNGKKLPAPYVPQIAVIVAYHK